MAFLHEASCLNRNKTFLGAKQIASTIEEELALNLAWVLLFLLCHTVTIKINAVLFRYL